MCSVHNVVIIFSREDLEKKVEKCGGGVLNDKTLQRAITEGHALDSTLVIACPSGFRRPNYLFAIAAGMLNLFLL